MRLKILLKLSHIHVVWPLSILHDSDLLKLAEESVAVQVLRGEVLLHLDGESLPVPGPDEAPPLRTVPGDSLNADHSWADHQVFCGQTPDKTCLVCRVDRSPRDRTGPPGRGCSSSWPCCRYGESRSSTWRTSPPPCQVWRPPVSPPVCPGRGGGGPVSRISQTADTPPGCPAQSPRTSRGQSWSWTGCSGRTGHTGRTPGEDSKSQCEVWGMRCKVWGALSFVFLANYRHLLADSLTDYDLFNIRYKSWKFNFEILVEK